MYTRLTPCPDPISGRPQGCAPTMDEPGQALRRHRRGTRLWSQCLGRLVLLPSSIPSVIRQKSLDRVRIVYRSLGRIASSSQSRLFLTRSRDYGTCCPGSGARQATRLPRSPRVSHLSRRWDSIECTLPRTNPAHPPAQPQTLLLRLGYTTARVARV
jgi:hypothetical protein